MTIGHEKSEWRRTSQMMTLTANMNRKSPLDWNHFYPFKEPARQMSVAEKEAIIKAMWIDKPTIEVRNE